VPLNCNYCTGEQPMKDAIAAVTPTSFKNVMNSLDTNHVVVRPDQFFQLVREVNGLPVNPICNITGIESSSAKEITNPEDKKAVVLYPNPVDNKIYIAGMKSTANLEVYSSMGQYLLKGTGASIDVSNLSPGTYFIRIRSGDKSQTYSFIKR
jgi:hypothetical protein